MACYFPLDFLSYIAQASIIGYDILIADNIFLISLLSMGYCFTKEGWSGSSYRGLC
jgi:hypothetical protein